MTKTPKSTGTRFATAGVLAAGLVAALTNGCGSSNPTRPTLPTTTSVRGRVEGSVAGADVNIRLVPPDGTIGPVVSGAYTTDASGNWSGTIPASLPGPFVVAASGGTYTDEATGARVTIPPGKPMYGFLLGTSSAVTPLTHTTFLATRALVSGGTWLTSAMVLANSRATAAFGFNPSTTNPSAGSAATIEQKKYAGLLGGLSTMLNGNPALGAFAGTPRIDLTLAVANDMTDGKLNGLDAHGDAILVPTDSTGTSTAPLPALSAGDLSAWLGAANTYCSQRPELSGVTFDPTLVWNATSASVVDGAVTFSGSGAPGLPSATFAPSTGHELPDEQLAWDDRDTHVEILIAPSEDHPGRVETVYIVWSRPTTSVIWAHYEEEGIAGVSSENGITTFTNAVYEEITAGGTSLTLNGQLSNPAP